jgi:hypothetical protein
MMKCIRSAVVRAAGGQRASNARTKHLASNASGQRKSGKGFLQDRNLTSAVFGENEYEAAWNGAE